MVYMARWSEQEHQEHNDVVRKYTTWHVKASDKEVRPHRHNPGEDDQRQSETVAQSMIMEVKHIDASRKEQGDPPMVIKSVNIQQGHRKVVAKTGGYVWWGGGEKNKQRIAGAGGSRGTTGGDAPESP